MKDTDVGIKVNEQVVNNFCYARVSSWITEDLDPDLEIRSRIEQARVAFMNMRALNLILRCHFVKWHPSIRANVMNRLEAFEMRV